MKTLLVLLALFISVAEAETYRCKNNGKTSFQDTPCETAGDKFDLGTDISPERQREAQAELKLEMNSFNQKKQVRYEAQQKERAIRAEEDKANAGYANARASRAQANQQKRTADAGYSNARANHAQANQQKRIADAIRRRNTKY